MSLSVSAPCLPHMWRDARISKLPGLCCVLQTEFHCSSTFPNTLCHFRSGRRFNLTSTKTCNGPKLKIQVRVIQLPVFFSDCLFSCFCDLNISSSRICFKRLEPMSCGLHHWCRFSPSRCLWVRVRVKFTVTMTVDHPTLIISSVSIREHLFKLWKDFLEALSRYHVHNSTKMCWGHSDLHLWQIRISSSTSASRYFRQIWKTFLKLFFRYRVHNNKMDDRTTQKTAVSEKKG